MERLQRLLDRLDRNEDGAIDHREAMQLMDPSGPGSQRGHQQDGPPRRGRGRDQGFDDEAGPRWHGPRRGQERRPQADDEQGPPPPPDEGPVAL